MSFGIITKPLSQAGIYKHHREFGIYIRLKLSLKNSPDKLLKKIK